MGVQAPGLHRLLCCSLIVLLGQISSPLGLSFPICKMRLWGRWECKPDWSALDREILQPGPCLSAADVRLCNVLRISWQHHNPALLWNLLIPVGKGEQQTKPQQQGTTGCLPCCSAWGALAESEF